MRELKLKAIVEKTSRLEGKFFEKYEDKTSNPNDLVESAVTIMRLKENIIAELNGKIRELKQEVLEAYEDGLNED